MLVMKKVVTILRFTHYEADTKRWQRIEAVLAEHGFSKETRKSLRLLLNTSGAHWFCFEIWPAKLRPNKALQQAFSSEMGNCGTINAMNVALHWGEGKLRRC